MRFEYESSTKSANARPDPATIAAMQELDGIGSIAELMRAKGYLSAAEAHRLSGDDRPPRRRASW
jgi:hypothetical protein